MAKAEAAEHRLRTACAQRGGAAQRSRNCVLATKKGTVYEALERKT